MSRNEGRSTGGNCCMLSACGGFKLVGREMFPESARVDLNLTHIHIRFLACTQQATLFLKLLSTASYTETYSNHQQHSSYLSHSRRSSSFVWDTVQVWGTRPLPSSLCAEMWQRQKASAWYIPNMRLGPLFKFKGEALLPYMEATHGAAWGYLLRVDSRLVTGSCTLYMQVCS